MSGLFNRGPPAGGGIPGRPNNAFPTQQRDPYGRATQHHPPQDQSHGQGYAGGGGSGGGDPRYASSQYGGVDRKQVGYGAQSHPQQQRMPGRGGSMATAAMSREPARQLRPAKSPSTQFTYGNLAAVSPQDFPRQPSQDFYIILNDLHVLTARVSDQMEVGTIGLTEDHRIWASITLTDLVDTKIFDPFNEGNKQSYLASIEMEVGFRGRKTTQEQMDQDELAQTVIKNFENQILAPGQRILMDRKGIALLFRVTTIRLGDLGMDKPDENAETLTLPNSRGILIGSTQISFTKDANSDVNLKASKRRPAANRILDANFKFEDMGIGGLDKQFSGIFRRAFASRLLPPGLAQEMGIQYVKGILLYGPPGTGKTLIARKIGQMLNAREPKVINGPEVLNKYVGQSEENIRKLFADAEAEYKEKGDESQLHVIIFDELDAVCKQRGSGTGGGTGVGDSIVNQLLSKLDGVNQLNNILLIGMTNRKDMIDDALLRPGRLEVHMEIPLPNEAGRVQILNIHTANLRKHNRLAPDVDIPVLAKVCKNYSGAELSGVVRAAVSYVASRNTDPGTMAGLSNFDPDKFVVTQQDFERAAAEVQPAFGVSEDEFGPMMVKGIIPYSDRIDSILEEGKTIVSQVQTGELSSLYTAILYGPRGAGASALASRIALNSGFPFIKLLSSNNMIGMHESAKLQHISKVLDDAYKSPLSLVVIDDIEQLFDWIDEGPRFENATRKALNVVLNKRPPEGSRLLIIATTSQQSSLQRLNMWQSFKKKIGVPPVRKYEELARLLEQSGVFSDVRGAITEIQQLTRMEKVNVGVKQVLYNIEAAQQHPENVNFEFAQQMAQDMVESNYGTAQVSEEKIESFN